MINVLVSTTQTQGAAPGDFSTTTGKVVAVDLTEARRRAAFQQTLVDAGWA